ncbi:Sph1p Ecym_8356 [Eremothecium cymbalariae DBVPG|uniref:GIT Spa2 homology (SHD) domain-containing protein n=1 Tax=Eremothecium cymbalariae (strain CBS 270.75 / DBVPG 7215 / KCTC 17166 / NRRL Y-17582) TaxID=931890 RepID=G8JXQ5_ERECY|nr:Hypothetical protein Ecym_8356 [Eremothecium cymbalariae DBVPG\
MVDDIQDLFPGQLNQVYGYYVALRQFCDVTGSSQDRSSSSRAQKARAKLLRLSPAQFFELSTDVYDELQRRIDEAQDQPDHLLPKEHFHVKRNQARQKLANLSQTRFNDLVDDILFEITRRGYHNQPVVPESRGDEGQGSKDELRNSGLRRSNQSSPESASRGGSNMGQAGQGSNQPVRKSASSVRKQLGKNVQSHNLNLENNQEAAESKVPLMVTPNTSIQTSQVIPKKASIDWSTEEEEDNFREARDIDDGHPKSSQPFSSDLSADIDLDLNISAQSPGRNHVSSTPSAKSLGLDESAISATSPLYTNTDSSSRKALSSLSDRDKDRDIVLLLEEGNKLEAKIRQMSEDYKTLEFKSGQLDGQVSILSSEKRSLNEKVEELSSQLQSSKAEINTLKGELSSKIDDAEKRDEIQQELTLLNKQLNELKFENEAFKQKNITLTIQLADQDAVVGKSFNDTFKSKLSALNGQLEELVTENQTLKLSNVELKNQLAKQQELNTNRPVDESFQKRLSAMSNQLNDLSIENETLKQTNTELTLKLKRISSITSAPINVSPLSSKGSNVTLDSISKFISPQGSISLPLIKSFNTNLETIFKHLSQGEQTGDVLFEDIARISDVVDKIINSTSQPDHEQATLLVKAANSHAITTIRYYATYPTILPVFTAESALTSISFAVCKLVSVAGLKRGSGEDLPITPLTKMSNETSSQPNLPQGGSNDNSISSLSHSSFGEEEVSTVKPLRITQKVSSLTPPRDKPSVPRRPSGTSLISSMMSGTSKKDTPKNRNKLNLFIPTSGSSSASRRSSESVSSVDKNSVPFVNPEINVSTPEETNGTPPSMNKVLDKLNDSGKSSLSNRSTDIKVTAETPNAVSSAANISDTVNDLTQTAGILLGGKASEEQKDAEYQKDNVKKAGTEMSNSVSLDLAEPRPSLNYNDKSSKEYIKDIHGRRDNEQKPVLKEMDFTLKNKHPDREGFSVASSEKARSTSDSPLSMSFIKSNTLTHSDTQNHTTVHFTRTTLVRKIFSGYSDDSDIETSGSAENSSPASPSADDLTYQALKQSMKGNRESSSASPESSLRSSTFKTGVIASPGPLRPQIPVTKESSGRNFNLEATQVANRTPTSVLELQSASSRHELFSENRAAFRPASVTDGNKPLIGTEDSKSPTSSYETDNNGSPERVVSSDSSSVLEYSGTIVENVRLASAVTDVRENLNSSPLSGSGTLKSMFPNDVASQLNMPINNIEFSGSGSPSVESRGNKALGFETPSEELENSITTNCEELPSIDLRNNIDIQKIANASTGGVQNPVKRVLVSTKRNSIFQHSSDSKKSIEGLARTLSDEDLNATASDIAKKSSKEVNSVKSVAVINFEEPLHVSENLIPRNIDNIDLSPVIATPEKPILNSRSIVGSADKRKEEPVANAEDKDTKHTGISEEPFNEGTPNHTKSPATTNIHSPGAKDASTKLTEIADNREMPAVSLKMTTESRQLVNEPSTVRESPSKTPRLVNEPSTVKQSPSKTPRLVNEPSTVKQSPSKTPRLVNEPSTVKQSPSKTPRLVNEPSTVKESPSKTPRLVNEPSTVKQSPSKTPRLVNEPSTVKQSPSKTPRLVNEPSTVKQSPSKTFESNPAYPSELPQTPSEGGDRNDDTQSYEEEELDFNVEEFDIENPDNTLAELLLYLEHQTMDVICTIQSLLTSIKQPKATTGELRQKSSAICQVIGQMVGATSVSMNQSRNAALKEHGNWVVQNLVDCRRRMAVLCNLKSDGVLLSDEQDDQFADKHFKQRLAGVAFDVAKCTKELVKSVEEASLKEEIEYLNSKLTK